MLRQAMGPKTLSQIPLRTLRKDCPVAVIDLGSNSVRLQIFRKLERRPVELHTEKFLLKLGRDLGKSSDSRLHVLSATHRAMLMSVMRRYVAIINNFSPAIPPGNVFALATAAMRDTHNGQQVAAAIESQLGLRIHIIGAPTEALLAALGAVASEETPHQFSAGLLGDLGGGSLELIAMKDFVNNLSSSSMPTESWVRRMVSLPLGVHRLSSLAQGDERKMLHAASGALGRTTFSHVIASGGSWRTIGKLYRLAHGYPDKNVHGFSPPMKAFKKFLRLVAEGRKSILKKAEGRADVLPSAARLLESVLTQVQAEKISFTDSGVVAGFLYAALAEKKSASARQTGADRSDVAAVRAFLKKSPLNKLLAPYPWEKSLMMEELIDNTLHKNWRGQVAAVHAFAAAHGLDEKERAFMAAAVSARCGYAGGSWAGLLSVREKMAAQFLGRFVALLAALTALSPSLLRQIRVMIVKKRLKLVVPKMLLGPEPERLQKQIDPLQRYVRELG